MLTYRCQNFGGCDAAQSNARVHASAGTVPLCAGCGLPLAPDRTARTRRPGRPRPMVVVAAAAVALATVLGFWAVRSAFTPAVEYSLIGMWHAEGTSILGYQLPVGVSLRFTERSAHLVDTEIPVVDYARDGSRVRVMLQSGAHTQVSLTFVFEDTDVMYFDGPLGLKFRYRRVRVGAPS